jgi:hypothetical protein
MSNIKISDFTHVNDQNKKDWSLMCDAMRSHIVQVHQDTYYYFLEVLPPIYVKGGFLVDEPLSHTKEGEPIYYFFFSVGEQPRKKYYGTISTRSTYEFCLKLAKEALEVQK